MQVFHIEADKLKYIDESPFRSEKELQKIIDSNLKRIFNLDLIKAQFPVGDLRIDTVAYDSNNKSFVLIEYKNNVNFSVIDQGYTYLNLLIANKAEFILLYREITGKELKKEDIDWSATRVLFISPEFTKYQVRAISVDLPIELIEIHRFSNDSIVLNRIETNKNVAVSATSSSFNSQIVKKVAREIKLYSEDYHLNKTSEKLKGIYQYLKDRIMGLGENIVVKPHKNYISFIASTNFVDIHVAKSKLKLWLNLKKGELNDPQHISRDVSTIGHWGNGEYNIDVKDEHNLEYLMNLIEQSYKKNS